MPTTTTAPIRSDSLFADTSGWLQLSGKDQPLHQRAEEAYTRALTQGKRIIITNYVITELVALIESRLRIARQALFQAIDDIEVSPYHDVIHIAPELHAAAWTYLKSRADTAWSLIDASSFVIMTRTGMTETLTTDRHFQQAGFRSELLAPGTA